MHRALRRQQRHRPTRAAPASRYDRRHGRRSRGRGARRRERSLRTHRPAMSSGPGPGALLERRIPATGEPLVAVGLGTWRVFDVGRDETATAEARDTLRAFVERGGRVVDSSPMYGSAEAVTGELAAEIGASPALVVATKVWASGRAAGIRQMGGSVAKPCGERPGPVQVHNLVDAATHLATLREWKAAGRIRYLGVTHYHAGGHAELERVVEKGGVDFVQVNYSLAEPEAGRRLLRAAADHRTAVIVNRPFADGPMLGRAKGQPVPAWAAEIRCATSAQA